MKIRKIEAVGFKSFGDKATMVFDEGITGVVGPNGCGKSNVVDAIKWVMGEMSVKNLRGSTMREVIFNGSENRGPMGMAEVTITFFNDGGPIPPEYAHLPEVSVTRRLHRDGESEYLINQQLCRLRDIHDLFMGTGVGRGAYAIIEQGRIGLIVNSRPTERRGLIEEAAGITKYKQRKTATERKIAHTRQNLLRIGDTVEELAKRKASLHRQKLKAERYRRYRTELRDIDLWRAAFRYLEQDLQSIALRSAHAAATERREAAEGAVETMEGELEQLRAELTEAERAANEVAERAYEVDNQLGLLSLRRDQAQKEQADVGNRAEEAAEEIVQLGSRHEDLEAEKARLQQMIADLTEREREESAGLFHGEVRLKELEAASTDLEKALEQRRRDASDESSRRSALEAKLLGLERRRGDLRERLETNRREAETVAESVTQLEGEGGELRGKLEQLKSRRYELAERRANQERLLGSKREELRSTMRKAEGLRIELGVSRAKLASLDQIARSYEGCAAGTQALMKTDHATPERGFLGLVGDMLETRPEYEAALEAALGERLQYVVVDGHDRAADAVRFLKSGDHGRSGFVPAHTIRPLGQSMKLPSADAPGVVGALHDLVQPVESFRSATDALLGDVMVVEDLPAAIRLWRSNGHTARLVTLDGEVLDPRGTLSGGGVDPSGAGLMTRKRERQDLRNKIAADGAALQSLEARGAELQTEVIALEKELDELRTGVHQGEIAIAGGEKELGRLEADAKRLFQQAASLEEARGAFEAALRGCDEEEETYKQGIVVLAASVIAAEEAVARLSGELAAVRDEFQRVLQSVTGIKARVAVVKERQDDVVKSLERLQREHSDLADREQRLRDEVARCIGRRAELETAVAEAIAGVESLQGQSRERSQELDRAKETVEQHRVRVGDREGTLRKVRDDERQAAEEGAKLYAETRELEVQRVHLAENIAERYREDIRAVVGDHHLRPVPGKETEDRAKELRHLIERMGEVNLTAVTEYDEVEERYTYLSQQKVDLEEALTQLEQAIVKINRTCRRRFRETFDAVNENFSRIFPRLFRGGKAHLALVGDDLLEAGVDIVASPPGKKLTSVALLSGGEKALTAIALLFAIFTLKPSPFCLLDEVDAPLDEANVGRYNEIIREMSSVSQFILITHNKQTMMLADTLYGVTMEEPGCSKLVSVRVGAVAAGQVAA